MRAAPRTVRAAVLVLASALAGCAGLPDESQLILPFGSITTSGGGGDGEGAAVGQAMEQVAVNRISTAEARARLDALRTCVSEARYTATIDPCLCYFTYGFAAPAAECGPTAAVPAPAAPVMTDAEVTEIAEVSLMEILASREGGPHLTPYRGHICWGHAIKATEGHFYDAPQTVGDCEALLERDVAQARTEAIRVFGRADDGRVELCFWTGCARFGLAGDLPAAVRADADLKKADAVRAERIARSIERAGGS